MSSAQDNNCQGTQALASGPYWHVLWLRVSPLITEPKSLPSHKIPEGLTSVPLHLSTQLTAPSFGPCIELLITSSHSVAFRAVCLLKCPATVSIQNTFVVLTKVHSSTGLPHLVNGLAAASLGAFIPCCIL